MLSRCRWTGLAAVTLGGLIAASGVSLGQPVADAKALAGVSLEDRERDIRQSPASTFERAEALLSLGHEYYRRGDFAKSLTLFEEAARTRTPPDLIAADALRMVAQTRLFAARDSNGALDAYKEMIAALDRLEPSSSEDRMRKEVLVAEAIGKQAYIHQTEGRYAESTALRERVLSSRVVEADRRAQLYVENGRDYGRLGKHEQAVASFDRLFSEFPGYQEDTGDQINLRLERAIAFDLDRRSPQFVALLKEIWVPEANKQHLQIFNVGRQVVHFASEAGDIDTMMAVGNELLRLIENRYSTLTEEQFRKYGIPDAYVQTVVTLATHFERNGDIARAIGLYERLLPLFPEGPFVDFVSKTLERLYKEKLNYDRNKVIASIDRIAPINAIDGGRTQLNLVEGGRESGAAHPAGGTPEAVLLASPNKGPDDQARPGRALLWATMALAIGVGALLVLYARARVRKRSRV